eukprot:c13536_g1_i1 orf=65-2662(+)
MESSNPMLSAKIGSCFPLMEAVSNGVLQGDVPLHFALPLLIIQIALVLFVTRSMAYLFKHIKQPRVLAEIIGGVLLGPTALGRDKGYMETFFPRQSMPLLETVATMGLMFFIFMVGLELDLTALGKTGRKAILIGIVGIATPFAASAALASLVKSTISPGSRIGPLIIFMGTPLSISAFSVLVRIMAELRLLSTEIGKLAIPSAAINDVAVWTLLAVGVAVGGPKHDPLIPLWVLLCGIGFGLIMFTVVRYFMTFIAHRAVKQGQGNDMYVCITLLCVLLAGFTTDAMGVHPLLGPFLLGLIVPKDNAFPKIIVEKIEDFVTGLMLPLFFASSGLKTNLGSLHGAVSLGFLVLFFATAAIGKITGTFVVAKLSGLTTKKALILGFLMNTKGLAVLIVLNIGRDLKALTDETFAILVLSCLLTSFVTFPVVTALCKLPAGGGIRDGDEDEESNSGTYYEERSVESVERGDKAKLAQLRVLACTDKDTQYAALVNLVEAARGLKKPVSGRPSSLKLYLLRLIHLSDRPSALLNMLAPSTPTPTSKSSSSLLSFPPSIPLSKVKVRPLPFISFPNPADSAHLDVHKLAVIKRASIIILPYLQHPSSDDGFSKAYIKVLDHNPPCSVAILVEKTSMSASVAIHPSFFSYNVLALFIGGADDREALSLASRMADHPGVTLKVIRLNPKEETFTQPEEGDQGHKSDSFHSTENDYIDLPLVDTTKEKLLDNEAIVRIKEKALGCSQLVYEEENVVEGQTLLGAINDIAKATMSEFNLFIVGRGVSNARGGWSCSRESYTNEAGCYSELGVVGNVFFGARSECHACILVVQQYTGKIVDKMSLSSLKNMEIPLSPTKSSKPKSSSFDAPDFV